jgi:adenine-specific DNA-methyltransferase
LKHFDDRHSVFNTNNLVSIKNYGHFSRGIATGANKFFILSKSEKEQRNLEDSLFLRCISKSEQIKKSVFTERDFALLEQANSPVFLFNLNSEPEGRAMDYIKYGEQCDYHRRYLTRFRSPWYKTEKRSPAPLLFGVFSRNRFKVNKKSGVLP